MNQGCKSAGLGGLQRVLFTAKNVIRYAVYTPGTEEAPACEVHSANFAHFVRSSV